MQAVKDFVSADLAVVPASTVLAEPTGRAARAGA
jgi:hypothetical protein